MAKDDGDGGTIDLFGDFGDVKKVASPEILEPDKKQMSKIAKATTDSLCNMIDVSKPKPKPADFQEIIEFSPDQARSINADMERLKDCEPEKIIIPKRDLTMDDQGWHRDFIPDLNDFAYLSNSRIKTILTSMRHFEWSYIKKIKSGDTASKRLGRIVHTAVLEPESFKDNHVIVPKFEGKGSRAAKAEFMGGLPHDAIVINETEVDKILYMIDSVQNHPSASKVLKGSVFEVNGYVWDERHELWWLIKPDALRTTVISDLKTSQSADPHDFSRDIFNYGYYIQAPIYMDQGSRLLKEKVTQFPFVVIENQAPYVCEVYKVADHLVETGRQLVDMAVNSYKFHMREYEKSLNDGTRYFWPGYTGAGGITEISIPTWAQYRLEALELAHIG